MSRNSLAFINVESLSSQGMVRSLSTEYIHLTANSMARRQLSTLESRSICSRFSAATAVDAKEEKSFSDRRKSKLVIVIAP